MSPDDPQLDELAQEIAGRLVPDIGEGQIIPADEVFAEIDEDEADRSVESRGRLDRSRGAGL